MTADLKPRAPRARRDIGQQPWFWIASAAIFVGNATLATFRSQWMAAVPALVTAGMAALAAIATWQFEGVAVGNGHAPSMEHGRGATPHETDRGRRTEG